MKHAFSLVELSIVLVILGLLTGGILAGQNLIRAAELRSVVTEFQSYQTAVHTFRDKYFALPGDMTNATSFWGADPNGCPSNAVTTGRKETCNGDGNGKIDARGFGATTDESFRFWQQLAAAGLIEGSYAGVSGAGNAYEVIVSVNAPRAKISNGLFYTYNTSSSACSGYIFPGTPTNVNLIGFGAYHSTNNDGDQAILKPEEAWNIDTKADDGRPGLGKVVQYKATNRPNCSTTDDPVTAEYDLDFTAAACHAIFLMR